MAKQTRETYAIDYGTSFNDSSSPGGRFRGGARREGERYLNTYQGGSRRISPRDNANPYHLRNVSSHRGGGRVPFGGYGHVFERDAMGAMLGEKHTTTSYGTGGVTKHTDTSYTVSMATSADFVISGDINDLYQSLSNRFDPDLAFHAAGGELIANFTDSAGVKRGEGIDLGRDEATYNALVRNEEHLRNLYTNSFWQ